jgi:XRE family transcriptional regulator, regulator of sulfur utilization
MRITRRDLGVAAGAALVAWSATSLAQRPRAAIIGPSTWEWNDLEARKTDVGEVRDVVRGPTATLEELEMHITTLDAGASSHLPHTHPNEELIVLREGQVETLSGGVWKRLGPGSIIFNASNSSHALRNVGTTPATYHVINWRTAATPRRTE